MIIGGRRGIIRCIDKLFDMAYYYPIDTTLVEIHYWFNDNSHTMDAQVQNRCERSLLEVLESIKEETGIQLTVETEPFGEGGFRQWLRITATNENANATITNSILVSFFLVIIMQPIGASLTEIGKKYIETKFEDPEQKALKTEKLRAEIRNIDADTRLKEQKLKESAFVRKQKSHFYGALKKYQKVDKISIQIQNINHVALSNEFTVERSDFDTLIDPRDSFQKHR